MIKSWFTNFENDNVISVKMMKYGFIILGLFMFFLVTSMVIYVFTGAAWTGKLIDIFGNTIITSSIIFVAFSDIRYYLYSKHREKEQEIEKVEWERKYKMYKELYESVGLGFGKDRFQFYAFDYKKARFKSLSLGIFVITVDLGILIWNFLS